MTHFCPGSSETLRLTDYALTNDREVDERVPGGRGLEVDPAAVHALLALLHILQVQPAVTEVRVTIRLWTCSLEIVLQQNYIL